MKRVMKEMTFEYVPTESEEQQAVMNWAAIVGDFVPDLRLLHHVPNGGFRMPGTARRMKSEGVRAGVPDLCLPVPVFPKHGLYIEMKRRDRSNRPSKSQQWWIGKLKEKGYQVRVCYGADEAIDCICAYLGIETNSEFGIRNAE